MAIITLDSVNSTNSYAKENFNSLANGDIIHALHQTSGRGRFSRKWEDLGTGNLFLTFVLKFDGGFLPVYSNITQYLSIILCRLFSSYGLSPKIKWPNDVLINNKKISGILAETVFIDNKFKGIILGVGVNLNSSYDNLKVVTDKVITSLNLETGTSVDMNKFINNLTNLFFMEYNEFINTGFGFIRDEYLSRLTYKNKYIKVNVLNQVKSGIIKDVNPDGELVLDNNGCKEILTMGDIL